VQVESEAVRLFIERARSARSMNFAVSSENLPAIAQITRRLDGVPLAIELAAARVRSMARGQHSKRRPSGRSASRPTVARPTDDRDPELGRRNPDRDYTATVPSLCNFETRWCQPKTDWPFNPER
jgi:hypothetical protein